LRWTFHFAEIPFR